MDKWWISRFSFVVVRFLLYVTLKLMLGYRNLRVYILAEELDRSIFRLTRKFPKSEIYSLIDQFLRSVHSIISNIAEGYGRRSYPREYVRFLIFAQASCHESREHLKTAFNRNYCSKEDFSDLDDKFDHIGKMLTLLIKKVKAIKTNERSSPLLRKGNE